MAGAFEVEVTIDSRELESKWSEQAVGQRMRGAMQEVLTFGQTEVRKNTPVDRGAARGSVQTDIRGSGVDIRGSVFSPLAYMEVLERGRRAGSRPPPTNVIRDWAERHGIDGKLAFVIARNIGRRGTKAHKMFEQAVGPVERIVEGVFTRWLNR